jgi:hypothetical protein
MLPIQLGVIARFLTVMAVGLTFLKFELAGVGFGSPLLIIIAVWHISNTKTKCAKGLSLSAADCHNRPDHSAELFVEGRKTLKAIKEL